MSKITIKVTLNTPNEDYIYTIPAILKEQEEVIIYKENDNEKTLTKFYLLENKLIRENKSILLIYNFKNKSKTTGKVIIKDINKTIRLNIKTNKILRCSNNIELDYLVEDEKYNYKIEVL